MKKTALLLLALLSFCLNAQNTATFYTDNGKTEITDCNCGDKNANDLKVKIKIPHSVYKYSKVVITLLSNEKCMDGGTIRGQKEFSGTNFSTLYPNGEMELTILNPNNKGRLIYGGKYGGELESEARGDFQDLCKSFLKDYELYAVITCFNITGYKEEYVNGTFYKTPMYGDGIDLLTTNTLKMHTIGQKSAKRRKVIKYTCYGAAAAVLIVIPLISSMVK